MVGGIYSDERCPICGKRFRDDGRQGLVCPKHPEQKATRFRVQFRGVLRRFKSYEAASRFLTGLRYKADEGTFDPRDYRADKPLGFSNLAERWLAVKRQTVKPRTYTNLRNYIERASAYWGNLNIKDIDYAEIEDFLLAQTLQGSSQPISSKTRANIRSALHDFWTWLRKRRIIQPHQMPEFPDVPFELGYRTTVDKETQQAILDEVHRLTYNWNPKVWLGIKWLCTYVSIRPGELRRVKEKHLDLGNRYLLIPDPKEKKPKLVPLLDEDVELVKQVRERLGHGLPEMHFFRHVGGIPGTPAGEPFGGKYFWVWWRRACDNLGIEGVDLYGGTRHSSVRALRQFRTPEEIKLATMHSTNKAFERYYRIGEDDLRGIYRDTQTDKELTKNFRGHENRKPLKS